MEAETVLNLFDSHWFVLDLFKPSKNTIISKIPSSSPEIPTLPTIHTKSSSHACSIFSPQKKLSETSSASPNSVLLSPKLQTIFSGKIPEDSEDSKSEKEVLETKVTTPKTATSSLKSSLGRMRRKKKGFSKSLSDLEFEELKGFIDLGFVFSEEDSDSSLATIIPGLQRLKHSSETTPRATKDNYIYIPKTDGDSNKNESNEGGSTISRPYLSESWEVLEKKKKENMLLNWRVPAPNDQVQMKDYLRFWAHTVASTVK